MASASSECAQTVKGEDLSPPSSGNGHHSKQSVFIVVFEGDALDTALLSVIEPSASKVGSVYIFTHTHDAFQGMIKIGHTSRPIDQRLNEWVECGHGMPRLLDSRGDVRHPARVERLTHFQLVKHWYAMRWCAYHHQAHTEWFNIDISTASQITQRWSSWIQRANPYDRRGCLKGFWRGVVEFLAACKICITAELMLQIQEVEEGLIDVRDFLDDDMLRKEQAKQGLIGGLDGAEAMTTGDRGHLTFAHEIKSENPQ
ncbi:hypothetical protein LTS18_007640 [Coniosporium uncinatum]|uniref:Uncharacterized protein n=1 Tax=Coniosporium uncinatum TaxID=93489 RepID=A0ACC3DXC3_9PEZI|nr:hypothetical protein LTS18_007640 [Coniosporium uncinatum]